MTALFLDTETYSPVPLSRGVHAYAEKAEIIMTSWALDDGPVEVEDGWADPPVDQVDRIVIHNSHFDRTVLRHAEGVILPIEKVWCTVAQARSVGLPGGLDKLCAIMSVPTDQAKDKAGKALIQLFCKPRPAKNRPKLAGQSSFLPPVPDRATKATHPEEWQRFREYAALDIEAMRVIYNKMPRWNYGMGNSGLSSERALWELDQRINDRGFCVDRALAVGAVAAVKAEQDRLAARCAVITDGMVEAATQRDKLLKHLLHFYGVDLPDMQKGTLERRVQDETLPDAVRELLANRLEASGTSTAKYQRLLDGVSSDGRLRGTLEWCGASRTGRWAGRLFQPQNLPRPWLAQDDIDAGIEAITEGVADLVIDDVIAHATNAIRGCIVAPPGKKLVVSDLSNIEGRVLAWLAGEDWKLKAFADSDAGIGHDLYHITAGSILKKPPGEVTKAERQSTGKVPELACGYQGAVGAFASMAALYGLVLPEAEVLGIVKAWRKANANIVTFWYELGDAALTAVRHAGVEVQCRKLRLRRDGAWLRILLPSGRAVCYPSPKVDPQRTCSSCHGTGKVRGVEPDEDTAPEDIEFARCEDCFGRGHIPPVLSYAGINPYTRQWSRIVTYGGKLVENVTQAVARDVIADCLVRAERDGFEPVLTVHDEIIAEAPDDDDWTEQRLSAVLATNPAWAHGLPLAAGGFEAKRYHK